MKLRRGGDWLVLKCHQCGKTPGMLMEVTGVGLLCFGCYKEYLKATKDPQAKEKQRALGELQVG